MFFNRIVAPRFLGREGDLATADKAEQEDCRRSSIIWKRTIPDSGWLVGDGLTLADIAVATAFANFRHLGITIEFGALPEGAESPGGCWAADFAGWVEREAAFLGDGGLGVADHVATVEWRSDGGFRDGATAAPIAGLRRRRKSCPPRPSPHVVAPADVGSGASDPEEALVASVSSCHMLCSSTSPATPASTSPPIARGRGTMGKDDRGRMAMTRIALRPEIDFAGEAPDPAELQRLHHEAPEEMLHRNSLRTEIASSRPPPSGFTITSWSRDRASRFRIAPLERSQRLKTDDMVRDNPQSQAGHLGRNHGRTPAQRHNQSDRRPLHAGDPADHGSRHVAEIEALLQGEIGFRQEFGSLDN